MYWLTLTKIKAQLRIETDFTDEDEYLVDLGEAAEEAVLTYCGLTHEDFCNEYGAVPAMVRKASLLLVDTWYKHRSPSDNLQLSAVPYGNVDFMLKPYMRLATKTEES